MLNVIWKLTKKPALRDGGTILFDQGILSISTFLVGILLARSVEKESYGIYVLVWTIIQFGQGVQRALITVPLTVYLPHLNTAVASRYLGSAVAHNAVLSISLGCFGVAVTLVSNEIGALHYENATRIAGAGLFALIGVLLRDFSRYTHIARLDVRAGTRVNVIVNLAHILAVAVLFGAGLLNVISALLVMGLCTLIAGIWMIRDLRGHATVVANSIWADFLQSWRTGKWVFWELLAYLGTSPLFTWLLAILMGVKEVAAFGVCQALAGLLAPLLRGASAYILPRMAHGFRGNDAKNLLRLTRLSIAAIAVPFLIWVVVGALFGEELVVTLYSTTYSGYGDLFLILLCRAMVESISTPIAAGLQTLGRADIVAKTLFAGTAVSLVVAITLLPSGGINAVGAGLLVGSLVALLSRWAILGRYARCASNGT